MFRRPTFALILGALLTIMTVGSAFATTPTAVLPWTQETNSEAYWEAYFGEGYECTKVDEAGDFTTTEDHDAIVVKAGQFNYIYQPAPAGDYSAAQEPSHWFYCDGPEEEDVIKPEGSIGGPCDDPAYYGVFDNTDSTVAIRFRFKWTTNYGVHVVTKVVPAGSIYRTWEHWAKPDTFVRVSYKSPDTGRWINLASLVAGHGSYPPCVYQRGFETPVN